MDRLNFQPDEIDMRILHELERDARISFSEIGRRVGLSSTAVTERVRRLEECGIIEGYHAHLNPVALGKPITVFIHIVSASGTCYPIRDFALQQPCVREVHHITGEKDVIVKASFESVRQLENLVEQLNTFGNLTTSLVLSDQKVFRGLTGS